MAQPDAKNVNTRSHELDGIIEPLDLPNPPPIYNNVIESVRSETTLASAQPRIDPLPEQTYVTPKERLGNEPEWIDCDFCRRRTRTRVERNKLSTGNEGVLACLLCLVCPCLICLACMGDNGEEVSHYCTGQSCNRKVTYKHPSAPIQVLQPLAPAREATKYGVPTTPGIPEGSSQLMKYERQM